MGSIAVNPAPGRRVRDPVTMRVIADGHRVDPDDVYWWRRLNAGDVVAVADSGGPDLPEPPASETSGPEFDARLMECVDNGSRKTPKSAGAATADPTETA